MEANLPKTASNGSMPEAEAAALAARAGMAEYPVAAILDVLRRGERFLVCPHARPDGDAVGSMLAVGMMLEQMGKRADLVTADRIPLVYEELPGAGAIRCAMRVHGPYDAVILLECDGPERARLRGLEERFLINIDHHVSGRAFGQVNWIDREACSVGEMIFRLVKAAGVTVTAEMAHCLYATVLTDTGGFCYGNLRASTFALARDLVAAGADPLRLARQVYFSTPASKVLLLGAALNNLKREGRLAWLWVTHRDMVRSCAVEEDCEGIANYALSIVGVEAAVFLRELPEQRIRLSLRSKGNVDVAAVAERFGGGGHGNAAGCTLDGPLSHALDEILGELRGSVSGLTGNGDREI